MSHLMGRSGGIFRLVGISGDQISVKGRIKQMNLVEHRILFEE